MYVYMRTPLQNYTTMYACNQILGNNKNDVAYWMLFY